MTKALDLINQRFNRLIVIQRAPNTKDGKTRWLCKCDCGGNTIASSTDLISGKVKSCGCYRKEVTSRLGKKHAITLKYYHSIYNSWASMKSRCLNYKNRQFKNYGGRGIKICCEWLYFPNFYNWAIKNYKPGLTLDRINVNGNYEPINCRWSTYEEQENNRRDNRIITINGKDYTLSRLAQKIGISSATLKWRLDHKWVLEDLFIRPNLANRWRRRI